MDPTTTPPTASLAPSANDGHRGLERFWGAHSLDELFGVHARVPTPWPGIPRNKHRPVYDGRALQALLAQPVALRDLDPRTVYANQPWILREHVAYYRTGRWERIGLTAADRHLELNQYPVVLDDVRGRPVIIAGHHRAAAALLAGRPLTVRVAATGGQSAITPLLTLDPHGPTGDPTAIAASIDGGLAAHVTTRDAGADVLRRLGLDDDTIAWRLVVATRTSTS